jgi:hypothetical protein
MLTHTIKHNVELKLSLIFGSAGTVDRIWTKLLVACSAPDTRTKLIDNYYNRWEQRLLNEVDRGSRELEASGRHANIGGQRRDSFQPRLEQLRANKHAVLYPK